MFCSNLPMSCSNLLRRPFFLILFYSLIASRKRLTDTEHPSKSLVKSESLFLQLIRSTAKQTYASTPRGQNQIHRVKRNRVFVAQRSVLSTSQRSLGGSDKNFKDSIKFPVKYQHFRHFEISFFFCSELQRTSF